MSFLKKYVIGEWNWMRPIKSVLSIYILLMIVVICFGDALIFPAPPSSYSEDKENFQWIAGESIASLYYPAKKNMPTLLWSHGNAEDIGTVSPLFVRLNRAGFGILAYDYPGYGLSKGEVSDKSCCETARRAYQQLREQHQVPAEDIIIVGQSVGSGPATYLASKKDTAGLILISPFTSIYRVAFKYPIFPRDRFPNISNITKVTEPLMILHGDQDTIIPQHHSISLLKAHKGTQTFHSIKDRGHNSISGRTEEECKHYTQLFLDFAESIKKS